MSVVVNIAIGLATSVISGVLAVSDEFRGSNGGRTEFCVGGPRPPGPPRGREPAAPPGAGAAGVAHAGTATGT